MARGAQRRAVSRRSAVVGAQHRKRFDLQNVQVLKGPQGTLFGKVTDGGAILLTPNRPGDEFGGEVQVKSGNYSLRGVDAAIDAPIVAGQGVVSWRHANQPARTVTPSIA